MVNVLYLLGNGFDLRLGLPTSYVDFLEYYQNQEPLYVKDESDTGESKSLFYYKSKLFELVEKLKEKGDPRWSDLEVILGKHTSVFDKDIEDFREFYTDLNTTLAKYLQGIAEFSPTKEMSEKFREDFLYPYSYLTRRELTQFKNKVSFFDPWDLNVVTFNYTTSFEALCEGGLPIEYALARKDSSYNATYRGIKHVHGILGETDILLGVDNVSQIDNEYFRGEEDVTDLILKPQSNVNCGSEVDDDFRGLIEHADLIYFFGLSFGETDQTWWQCIKERFTTESRVILFCFHYEHTSLPKLGMDKKPERQVRQKILQALGIDEDEKNYRDRIFIAVNTEMFPRQVF